MKALRGLLAVFLILIIVGGLGYIVWSFFLMPGMNHSGMNTTPPAATQPEQNQIPGTQNNGQQQSPQGGTSGGNMQLNTTAARNRDKLNQAVNTINQALDLITIDPYSKTTVSGTAPNATGQNRQDQPGQGSGTINIYPAGSGSVNIYPSGNTPANNPAVPANTNQGAADGQQGNNYVYDQTKLQQLHNGIFTLAQGVTAVNSLNDDLLIQASMSEASPPNYQTYVTRYNTALQNKTRLNNAMSMLSQASTLINVNPYASPDGYQYNSSSMQQLHQGIYKLAQGVAMLTKLNEDFTGQMAEAAVQVQNLANASYQMTGMTSHTSGVFGTIGISAIFNIILILLVVGLIAGVLGAIYNMFRSGRRNNGNGGKGGGNGEENSNTDSGSNSFV